MDSLPCNSRLPFRSCALHRRATVALQESLPAVQRSANPNTLYLFLVFAEYMPILLPILQRKHSIVNMSGTVFSTMAEVFTRSVILITLYLYDHPVFYQSPCRLSSFPFRENQSQSQGLKGHCIYFERCRYLHKLFKF